MNNELLADIRHELVTLNLLIASYVRYAATAAVIGSEAPGQSERTMVRLREAAELLLEDIDQAMNDDINEAVLQAMQE